MQIGPAGTGSLEGAVRHVGSFGPIQRAEVALSGGEGETIIEIDAPRDRELQAGEIISLQPAATGSLPRRTDGYGLPVRTVFRIIPGWSEGPDLRCAIAHRGILRFRVRSLRSRPEMTVK